VIPESDPAGTADSVVNCPIPIPKLETLSGLILGRGWGATTPNPERRQTEYSFNDEGLQFFRLFFQKAPDVVASLMLKTDQGEHSFSVAVFQSLTQKQQIDLMNRMVALARGREEKPGWMAGVFLPCRLLTLLAADSASPPDVWTDMMIETFQFILEELFILHSLRPSEYRPATPEAREAFAQLTEWRYKGLGQRARYDTRLDDEEYLEETVERYPGLNPESWVPFLRKMPLEKLEAILEPPALHEGVRSWLAHLLKAIP
jgi:hypothetical protein